ncbi:hypothetical protein SDC9_135922 [bioreactor metagenome]|uniref:Uncharacterized protein n=1 Tax=bioreactor metagenome TaxID=1076179 RepID=A0A645DIH4_9ZZZZ
MLNMFPKLELAVILMYFMMLPKVLRPSITPSFNTIRSFSSKMISADSFAISTAVSTETLTSASFMAGASLIPSPMKPTVWPLLLMTRMIRAFCIGDSFAKIVTFSASVASCSSVILSILLPNRIFSTERPTSLQIFLAITSLSPVRIFTSTPYSFSALIAEADEVLGGSRKPI